MSISHSGAVAAFAGPAGGSRAAARPSRADGGFAATLAGAMGNPRPSERPAPREEASAPRAADRADAPESRPAETNTVAAARERAPRDEERDHEHAAAAAESAAAAAAAPSAPADPTRQVSSLSGLDPEFRARLQRVVDRMEREHGHSVKILETVRSQARQEHLFAQGRSRPGPVVTWTLNSNHRTGRAADLLIDGKWNNPEGYRHLARIASEEGLRTLGAKDPGHVELPRGQHGAARFASAGDPSIVAAQATGAVAARAEQAVERRDVVGPGGVARVAEVARVASVARVAEVARVASPGREGRRSGGAEGEGGQQPAIVESAFARSEVLSAFGAARETPNVGSTDMVGRLARILEMKDASGTSQLGSMVLRMENGAGGEDRVRVAMRGGAFGATIEPGAGTDADRLLRQLPELQRTLERQGVRPEGITVRPATAAAEVTPETLRLALDSASDAARGGSNGRSGGDGGAQHRDPRSAADHDQPRRRNSGHGQDEPGRNDQERRT